MVQQFQDIKLYMLTPICKRENTCFIEITPVIYRPGDSLPGPAGPFAGLQKI
jgi:hypothetical protein